LISHAITDSSVAIKWVVEEDDSKAAATIATATLEAPDVLLTECANILWKKVTLTDLSSQEAIERWQLLLEAPIQYTATPDLLENALKISLELHHPVYDCVYLALARERKLPLITADRKLVTVVRRKKGLGVRIELLSELPR
jgi:predicted nucleic acid-binding protein